MKSWVLGWVVVLAVAVLTQSAQARPHHEGFTGDLGIGLALTFKPEYSETICGGISPGCVPGVTTSHQGEWGLAPLSLSLGGWVSPKVALLARATGTSYFRGGDQISNNFYGAAVEVWPINAFYLSGGVGFGIYGPNPIFSRSSLSPQTGFALDFRVGAALAQGTNHDFTLSFEAIPGFYDGDSVTGLALVGAWKWY